MPGKAYFKDNGDSLTIGYEDYGVGAFGDSDCEVTYALDQENRTKLFEALADAGYAGRFEEMMITCFGSSLEKTSFADFCGEHGIGYERHVWIS